MKKTCARCRKSKDKIDFGNSKFSKDKLRCYCRKCNSLLNTIYQRSINGLISKIYATQIRGSKQRGHNPPTYTKQELIDWVLSQPNFKELYDNWVKSGYKKDLIPSVDRPDDYKGYSFNNIQLMTWKENNEKHYNDKKNGINTKNCKSVIQYDLNMNFIKEFKSIKIASRELNINDTNISLVCKNKRNTSGGFIWRYK